MRNEGVKGQPRGENDVTGPADAEKGPAGRPDAQHAVTGPADVENAPAHHRDDRQDGPGGLGGGGGPGGTGGPGGPGEPPILVRERRTKELTPREVREIRKVLFAAFEPDEHGGFSEDDWQHALGGVHFLAELNGQIVGHASVVERELRVDGGPLRTGYVEAVAVVSSRQRTGIGSALMRRVNEHIAAHGYELGALGTGSQPFYERLGWRVWQGPSSVRMPDGERPTPDEDGYIMVLATPHSPALRLTEPLSCEWRPGDVW